MSKKFCSVIIQGIYHFTTFLQLSWHDAIDEWYRLLIQFVTFLKEYYKKISNLIILDNSGIDYSRMLLFVFCFLVYWKIEPNSRASGNTWFTTWLQTGHVKVVRKTKSNVTDNNFLGFITINNISTPFFNWKIAAILFVSVIDYY